MNRTSSASRNILANGNQPQQNSCHIASLRGEPAKQAHLLNESIALRCAHLVSEVNVDSATRNHAANIVFSGATVE